MRILIISPSLDPKMNVSGISSVVSNIMKFGQNQYFHFELGSTDKTIADNTLMKTLRLLHAFYRYVLFMKRIKPDLVHMNVPTNLKGILRESVILNISKLFGKKVIVHLHGGEFLMEAPQNKILKNIFKNILLKSDKLLVLSEVEKDSLSKLYNFHEAKILYNGVDSNNLSKVVKKDKSDRFCVLFLGRIHESKGLEDLVEAVRLLYPDIPFRLILCGAGPLQEVVITALSRIMHNDFEYKGVVTGEEKQDVILSSDIFILPSRYGEGLPMALLESMSAGLIPVVTDDASMKYVIIDNDNGIRVEKNNPNDIYIKLKDLFENPEKMALLSVNARKTIIEKYDVRLMVENLEKIYAQI